MSKIEWTEKTWNPVTGCMKISQGCKHCYAETLSRRLQAMGVPGYENGFLPNVQPSRLEQPLSRKKPTLYFVCSMSDLFQDGVTFDYIDRVLDVIRRTPRHTYQVLTKRAHRMWQYFQDRTPPPNAWLGVSVENQRDGIPRVWFLRMIPDVTVRFLSVEPLLEDLEDKLRLDMDGCGDISWVIVGGESGPGARPMKRDWVVDIRDQCIDAGIPFFFKQWGGTNKKKTGRLLDGRTWDEFPKGTWQFWP